MTTESFGVETSSPRSPHGPSVSIPMAGETWDRAEAQRRMDRDVEWMTRNGDPGVTYTFRLVRLNARYAPLKTGAGVPVTVAIPALPTFAFTVVNDLDPTQPSLVENPAATRKEIGAHIGDVVSRLIAEDKSVTLVSNGWDGTGETYSLTAESEEAPGNPGPEAYTLTITRATDEG